MTPIIDSDKIGWILTFLLIVMVGAYNIGRISGEARTEAKWLQKQEEAPLASFQQQAVANGYAEWQGGILGVGSRFVWVKAKEVK